MKLLPKTKYILLMAIIAIFLTSGLQAMPPHPSHYEANKIAGNEADYSPKVHAEELARGINAPSKINNVAKATVGGSFNILAVLINFPDVTEAVTPEFFDTLIYGNTIGTVHHYYDDVSYGQLNVTTIVLPSDIGWITAPEDYGYYVDGQRGLGSYPNNARKLCEDVVNLIDGMVDFSDYDNDGDGYVDGIILVHTGSGYEFSHDNNDIHSHKWATSTPLWKDGVYVYEYSIQPEFWNSPGDMTCGVYCHELGHIFGLPDLYDTDYSSRGVGYWSLMAAGSWLGPGNMGGRPSEPDAWSRISLGFKTATNILSNANDIPIASIESDGPIYRLWTSGTVGQEYYLVENRQQTGYGQYLPGSGLLIWHIDESQMSGWTINDHEWYPGYTDSGNYAVALEQADNLFQLEKLQNAGNSGDPFPGSSNNNAFTSLSFPSTNSYDGENTYVAISDISPSGTTMTADFQVSLLSDVNDEELSIPNQFEVDQNYPNPFNAGTRISFSLPASGQVSVEIINIIGEVVDVVANDVFPPGGTTLNWYGKNLNGNDAPSGIYLYKITTKWGSITRKMTLLK